MTIPAPLATAVAGVAAAVAASATPQAPRIDLSPRALVQAAAGYVERYNIDMQNVLAEELATQRVRNGAGAVLETRVTRAELFITFLPADSTWITVRDVREADGQPVTGPDNIRALIDRAPLSRLGSVIAEKNARFNIGSIRRTFNEPTLALLVLADKHRGRFRFDRTSTTGGPSPKATLAFRERDRPTLVTTSGGAAVFSRGELVVDAATGRVEMTSIDIDYANITSRIETTYADDPKLKMWVPAAMHEAYAQRARGAEQAITTESTYSNYRRFETSVVIK
jgi:hypothetical protein